MEPNEITDKTEIALSIVRERQNSAIPIQNEDTLRLAIADSLHKVEPLNFVTICCPNWVVIDGVRSVAKMNESLTRPTLCFGMDLPGLLKDLLDNSIRSRILIVVSDIVPSWWVTNRDHLQDNIAQNVSHIKQILWRAAEQFGIARDVEARVLLQSAVTSKIPEAIEVFARHQTEVLLPSTPTGQLAIGIWNELDAGGAYPERRADNTGLRSILERALFLASLYATDGLLLPRMIQTAFKLETVGNVIGINLEMDIPFAKILISGWTLRNPLPVITPTSNGTDWDEPPIK